MQPNGISDLCDTIAYWNLFPHCIILNSLLFNIFVIFIRKNGFANKDSLNIGSADVIIFIVVIVGALDFGGAPRGAFISDEAVAETVVSAFF